MHQVFIELIVFYKLGDLGYFYSNAKCFINYLLQAIFSSLKKMPTLVLMTTDVIVSSK